METCCFLGDPLFMVNFSKTILLIVKGVLEKLLDNLYGNSNLFYLSLLIFFYDFLGAILYFDFVIGFNSWVLDLKDCLIDFIDIFLGFTAGVIVD